MWSKKWYLKRNTSCDAHLFYTFWKVECLEMMPSWCRQVNGGNMWDSLSKLRCSLCERRVERTVPRSALLPVKTAQFTRFFRQVWHHTVKSLSLMDNGQGALQLLPVCTAFCSVYLLSNRERNTLRMCLPLTSGGNKLAWVAGNKLLTCPTVIMPRAIQRDTWSCRNLDKCANVMN
jgi:hypothetical protein